MNIFGGVTFGPDDVRTLAAGGEQMRCVKFAILTSQTCGEACWHAAEEVCRCSCGGRNHGCLKSADGVRPVRMAKIAGHRYKLAAVGMRSDVMPAAKELNGRQWRAVERPTLVIDGEGKGVDWTPHALAAVRAAGKEAWISQYRYHWTETDDGAPARVKYATREQLAKWEELKAWRGTPDERNVCLLWEREEMPAAPSIKIVSKTTGEPLANQSPLGEQI